MSLVSMSFYGAVLIVLILALRPVVKRYMPKRTLLVMWWVALCRLLIPFDIPWRFSAYSAINGTSPVIMARGITFDGVMPQNGLTRAISGVSTAADTVAPEAALSAPISEFPILPAIYFAGLILTLAFFAVSYIRLMKSVRGAREVTDENILAALVLRRRVRVLSCENITSPFTFGLFRPVIALPEGLLSRDSESVRSVLLHEIIHIRRFDAPLKMLVILTACVHWFNPFCWIMAFVYARDTELACDSAVVRELGYEGRAGYAETLLSLRSRETGLPLTGGFSRLAVKERIVSIMKYRRASIAATFLAASLVLLVAAAFATSPEEIAKAASDIVSSLPMYAYDEQIGSDEFHPTSCDVSESGKILFSGYTDTGKGKIGTLITCDVEAYSDWDKLEVSREAMDPETYTLNDSEYIDAKFIDNETIAVLRGIRWGDDYHYSAMLVKNDLDIMKADCLSKTEYGIYALPDGFLLNGKPDGYTVRITRMDLKGSALWQILLAEPVTFNGILTSGGVHMAYGRMGDQTDAKAFILAFDDKGSTLWRYEDSVITEFTDGVLTNDGDIVLVGYDLGRTGEHAASVIASFDKSGKQLFVNGYVLPNSEGEYTTPNASDTVFSSVARMGDGFAASVSIPDELRIRLVMYDGEGVIISERDMLTSGMILSDNTTVRADGVKLINALGETFIMIYGRPDANYSSWIGDRAYVTVLRHIAPVKNNGDTDQEA